MSNLSDVGGFLPDVMAAASGACRGVIRILPAVSKTQPTPARRLGNVWGATLNDHFAPAFVEVANQGIITAALYHVCGIPSPPSGLPMLANAVRLLTSR